MNKWRLYIAALSLCGIAGYLAYRIYFPDLVAKSITDGYDFLIPNRFQDDIEKLTEPINDGATKAVAEIHKAGVTIDQVLQAIDDAKEEQALALLDDLNTMESKNPDEVFDLIKKHFPANFDTEVFREPFTQRVSPQDIQNGLRFANQYKEQGEVNAEIVKSIMKRILIQKEAEFNDIIGSE